jgi:hypothetical protein
LDSPRWKTLDGNGELAARLLQLGAAADFAELDHQACHQLTVYEVAYAIVPHVIAIAQQLPLPKRVWPLVIAGTVAASRSAYPHRAPAVPPDLRAEFEQANADALQLAADAIRCSVWDAEESLQLLAVIAGFQGRGELAIQLFLCVPGEELACPSCGERLCVSSATANGQSRTPD